MGAASKQKGAQFERDVCVALGLWLTGGKRRDVFWRSAMSGGRATVARKKGKDVRQAGDITAVAPEGHKLTDHVFIECKFYADLQFDTFVVENKGLLAQFWSVVCHEAGQRGKSPWLIARQNRRPTLLLTLSDTHTSLHSSWLCMVNPGGREARGAVVWLFDEVLGHKPPRSFKCESSASISMALSTRTVAVGRERL